MAEYSFDPNEAGTEGSKLEWEAQKGERGKREGDHASLKSFSGNLMAAMQIAARPMNEGQAELAANAGRMSNEILEEILPKLQMVHLLEIVTLSDQLESNPQAIDLQRRIDYR